MRPYVSLSSPRTDTQLEALAPSAKGLAADLDAFAPVLGKTSERQRDQTLQTYETFNTDCLVMCGIQYVTGCGWM